MAPEIARVAAERMRREILIIGQSFVVLFEVDSDFVWSNQSNQCFLLWGFVFS